MKTESNIDELRAQFPVTKRYSYLNHAAVGPLPQHVLDEVNRINQDKGYSGGLHWMDWEAEAEETRKIIAKLINANAEEIAFVQNTSVGLSIIANGINWEKTDNILINDLEFPSNLFPWQTQAKRHGLEIRTVQSNNEELAMEDFEEQIDGRTKIVAVSHVQFSNGFKIDLQRLSKLAHKNNAYVITDAVQSLGQMPIDVKKLDVDFLATSGYKWLLSPIATGFLYIKKELIDEIVPSIVGYRTDENYHEYSYRNITLAKSARRFEHGQINFPGIVGMRAAIEILESVGIHNIERRIRELIDYLIAGISELKALKVISSLKPEHRNGIIKVGGLENPDEAVAKLKENNIVISSRAGGLRISPHFYNTKTEIDRLLDKLSLLT
ncbi:MAG: aminotransferase class V-fold PLP-dependent enzyme [Promethearchaeota archaeon]